MPTLNWRGKDAVLNHHLAVPYHLLRCEPSMSAGEPGSGNLIVEGDNLTALKALLPYYKGQVKCIYIDPPYNTGNEGWVYNDNVNSPEMRGWLGKVVGAEAEDLSRHDKWLCMMWPRLKLLKEFLRQDGVIFVSIDDYEVHNLRYIMDEIFGRENFVVNMIWQKMDSPSSNFGARAFSNYHDYTLVYAREAAFCKLRPREKPEILAAYPEIDESGKRCRLRQLRKNGKAARRQDRPTMWYSLTAPDGTLVWPVHPTEGWEGRWAIGADTYAELDSSGAIAWRMREHGWVPYQVETAPDEPSIPNPSILTDAGQNRQAKATLNEILGTEHGFETPKPVGLLERILRIVGDPQGLILDSFAGSGTTAHAVLKLNAEDGGNRRFILVEMDPTIAQTITSERVRRVAAGYTNAKGEAVPGLGGGFRYCRLGAPLFAAHGGLGSAVTREALAYHVYFTETGEPLPHPVPPTGTLIGACAGRSFHLLYDAENGVIVTEALLAELPQDQGHRIVFADACLVPEESLREHNVTFKQIPYAIRG